MDVRWDDEVVEQLDRHWTERLRPRLEGLTDDEYLWQPVPGCWTVSRRGESSAPVSLGSGDFTWDFGEVDGPPPVTTIAWRLAHLLVGFAETSGTYFGGPPVDVRTFSYPGTAGEALRRLDAEYVAWLDGVRRLGVEGLAAPQGPTQPPEFADAPMARLVLYTHVEVVHHGAEVCLLRDLYARR